MVFALEVFIRISIHALREEGDPSGRHTTSAMQYFYPRPPRGGRLWRVFQDDLHGQISIHALREEGDSPRFASIGS